MARSTRLAACLLVVDIVLTSGCSAGSKSDASVSRTDSAGVAIVVNHGPDRPLHWTFTPVLTLGGKDSGPEAFFHVYERTLTVDSAGHIYLVDIDDHRLVAFDSEGHALWSVGHEGHGPGEFTYPFQLALDAASGQLVVVDGGNAVIDRFDLAGQFLGAQPLPPGGFTARSQFFGDDKIIERVNASRDNPTDRSTNLLLIEGADTVTLRSLPAGAAKMIKVPDCPISVMMPPIFTPALVWGSYADRTVVTAAATYVLWTYRAGRLVASYRRDLTPLAATPDLASTHFPNGEFRISGGNIKCQASGAAMAKLMGYASVVPFVRQTAVGPDGAIWVRRGVTSAKTQPVDVFDSTGAYLGSLPDSTPWPYAFMPNGDVVSAKSDTTTGVTKLVVYRVTR